MRGQIKKKQYILYLIITNYFDFAIVNLYNSNFKTNKISSVDTSLSEQQSIIYFINNIIIVSEVPLMQ